jgi:hypothetical protein
MEKKLKTVVRNEPDGTLRTISVLVDDDSDEFTKYDTDKVMVELVEPAFIMGLGSVLTYGAKKYSPDNWKQGNDPENIRRIQGALMRHILAYRMGEKTDPETGLSHLHHATANLMFLAHFDEA